MKVLALSVLVVLVCIVKALPIENQDVQFPEIAENTLEPVELDDAVEPMEMLNGARQRICTAALCHNMCRSLGWRTGSCNAQRYCICRR